jgi:hypothetical protein
MLATAALLMEGSSNFLPLTIDSYVSDVLLAIGAALLARLKYPLVSIAAGILLAEAGLIVGVRLPVSQLVSHCALGAIVILMATMAFPRALPMAARYSPIQKNL